MTAKVQMWGNSLAIRLPKIMATEAHLFKGTDVLLVPTAGGLTIKPKKRGPRPTLKSILQQCKGKNPHSEIDLGGPVGSEAW